MNTLATLLVELARYGLLAALLLLASINVLAASASLDGQEIPTFVLERTELVRGTENLSSAPPCNLPGGSTP